jgi:arabinose-5-phosphate isomerase
MGLAPTTSTTMQLGLGDAIAVALLTRRGFTASDFSAFHPGGRLGAKLRRVREVMHAEDAVPLIGPDAPMQQALLLMTGKGFGCVGVVGSGLKDEGRLIGVVTDGDLRRAMGPRLLEQSVREVMTPSPRTIRADALAADALHAMNAGDRRVTSLFVVDPAGRPIGIIHVHDLLRAGIA